MAMWNDQQKTDLAYCMGHTFEAMTASYEATGIFVRDGDTRPVRWMPICSAPSTVA